MTKRWGLFVVAMMMPACLSATSANATLMCAGGACTESIALFAGTTTSSSNSPQVSNLSKFDPALGVLNSAILSIDAIKLTAITIASANPASAQETVNALAYVSAFLPPSAYWFVQVPQPINTTVYQENVAFVSRACTLAPGEGCTDSAVDEVPFQMGSIALGDLASLTGPGTFGVTTGVFGLARVCELTDLATGNPVPVDADRTCTAEASSTLSGTLSIEYQYTPFVAAIPAASALPLFAGGLVGLAVAGFAPRRWRR